MADNFEYVGTQVLPVKASPTETVDVQRLYVRALPSGIVFPLDYSTSFTGDPNAGGDISTIAARFNDAFRTPGILDIVVNEDTDEAGYTRLTYTTYVQASKPGFTTQFSGPYSELGFDGWKAKVAAALAELNALAGV